MAADRSGGGVQSVHRAFELLELMADAGGEVTLSQLAVASELPLPTIHRLLRTLVDGGYVRQQPSRRYALGPRLIRLGETAGRVLGAWARPYLAGLTDAVGETSNMAVLDGDQVVYVAQVPSPHSMRMFTEVGRRADAHSTAVGKAVLAQLPCDAVDRLLTRAGMRRKTEHTIVDLDQFRRELATIRAVGYAEDDGEQEIGVRCIAVTVPGAPTGAAISISGPATRMSLIAVADVVPLMHGVARSLARELHVASHWSTIDRSG
ncbi:MAG TPA: IclR family transcriptional regulator [Pseudonocardiaceae bacterium]|nr:IclR family transcriptional regulator [Pseudonocardiaceae bacterium]